MARSLQMEWQYVQRVVSGIGPQFAPVEEAITSKLLPSLLDTDPDKCAFLPSNRKLLELPVKCAGMGIPNPCTSAESAFNTSTQVTSMLVTSLRRNESLDVASYLASSRGARDLHRAAQKAVHQELSTSLIEKCNNSSRQRRLRRAPENGAWLSMLPTTYNQSCLSADEFRDNLRLRYGLTPNHIPSKCDGCGEKFTSTHAMCCKKGGLITIRHNDIKAVWSSMCADALTPSCVSDEPLIYTSRGTTSDGSPSRTEPLPDDRGDVAVHGFWTRGRATIFDVRVTDPEAPYNQKKNPAKILLDHEKEKKTKYLEACLERQRDFTPLVFSVDGLRSKETDAACKHLAALLAKKWERSYSEVCSYVRCRLALSLCRATSMCLRGARDKSLRPAPSRLFGDGAALLQFF